MRENVVFDARKPWRRRRLTFELTGTLRWADFGLGSWAQNRTAAKCPVERVVRPRRASSLSNATIGPDAIWRRVAGYLNLK